MTTSNETLIKIIAAGLRAKDSLPAGDWQLHRHDDSEAAEIYVVRSDGRVADHVASCSTHELDDYLLAIPPQVGVDLARDLIHIRGVAGSLLDAIDESTTDGVDGERFTALRETLRQMVSGTLAPTVPAQIAALDMPEAQRYERRRELAPIVLPILTPEDR